MTAVPARTLFVTGAGTYPPGEAFLGWKGRCGRTDFGNDLLRRLHSETRHLREPLDCILVGVEQTGQFLIQLANLLLKEVQLLQRHLHKPAVNGLEVSTRAESVTQLPVAQALLPVQPFQEAHAL